MTYDQMMYLAKSATDSYYATTGFRSNPLHKEDCINEYLQTFDLAIQEIQKREQKKLEVQQMEEQAKHFPKL